MLVPRLVYALVDLLVFVWLFAGSTRSFSSRRAPEFGLSAFGTFEFGCPKSAPLCPQDLGTDWGSEIFTVVVLEDPPDED